MKTRLVITDPQGVVIPEVTDRDIHWASSLLGLPGTAFFGPDGTDPRQTVLKSMEPMDVAACPGSGKTTLLVAKLAILAEKWNYRTRGICVLSHTNAARNEIETCLGNASAGRRLLSYPHFIGTIHGFVNDFLAVPWLRSQGYPIKMIDTDICLEKRWRMLSFAIRNGLQNNRHEPSVLVVKSPDFSVGDVRWSKKATLGKGTRTYTAIQNACRQSAIEGFFCYDEMFVWASDVIDKVPGVTAAIRDRFPIFFIDEAQDNSEQQSSILHRIFMEGGTSVTRQRFGDGNQAIFDFMGGRDATTDKFPDGAIKKDLPNSHRFGQRIADLADPLGLSPYGLKGQGPKKVLASDATEGYHTVFLFEDKNADKVMDAYGALLLDTFSEQELTSGTFTAVGQVHRRSDIEESKKFPHHVGHYWASYDPELTSYEPKPRTFVQCILAGRGKAEAVGEAYLALEPIAEGILRLAEMTEGRKALSHRRHRHRQILVLLDGNPGVRESYEDLVVTFAMRRSNLTQETWTGHWCNVVRQIAEAVAGGNLADAQAKTFLAWPEGAAVAVSHQAVVTTRDNIYRYPLESPKVSIRVGSIHSVKGQTHTATLVLETFWQGRNGQHNLELLLPWICGSKSGGGDSSVQQQARLKLHYVAMTRPTHLLCLAMRVNAFQDNQGALDIGAVEKMRTRGWHVKVI